MNVPWTKQLASRFAYLWWAKALISMSTIYGFFQLYFYLLKYPKNHVYTIPNTPVDAWIAFSPLFLWIYVSLWVFVSLPTAFLGSLDEAKQLLKGLGGVCTVALLSFYLWPTQIDIINTEPSAEVGGIYDIIKSMDTSGNSCPSLHVATAVYACGWLYDLCKRIGAPRILNWINILWCLAIVYATMAIKQHVLLDVVGGLVLAIFMLSIFRLNQLYKGFYEHI